MIKFTQVNPRIYSRNSVDSHEYPIKIHENIPLNPINIPLNPTNIPFISRLNPLLNSLLNLASRATPAPGHTAYRVQMGPKVEPELPGEASRRVAGTRRCQRGWGPPLAAAVRNAWKKWLNSMVYGRYNYSSNRGFLWFINKLITGEPHPASSCGFQWKNSGNSPSIG